MSWKEVTVELNNDAAEAVANIMNELGSGGVVADTNKNNNNNNKNRVRLTAYYYNDEDFPELFSELKGRINKLADFSIDTGELLISLNDKHHQDWATSWHKYFKPLDIGKKFIVCPSWETVEEGNRQIIKIDPGMAFGIGGHETTQMCVSLLEKYIVNVNEQKNMLDIGTGTGILTIVAAYLGIQDILGIDLDPAAVSAARENISINQVEDNVRIIKGDMTKDINNTFSIITANLLPNLIMRLLPSVPPLMSDKTKLILSGIIPEKKDIIVDTFGHLGLKLIDEEKMNDWLSLVAIKE